MTDITDEELKQKFREYKGAHKDTDTNFKSLAPCINALIREKMECYLTNDKNDESEWKKEVDIFNGLSGTLGNTEWRLDFACKDAFAVEVAFNHGEAIARNLIKPCLASELNHVDKAIQTSIGIYVCATDELKVGGNLDGATGEYEKVCRYLKPMMNQLVTPMMIIGLEASETFHIDPNSRDIKEGKNLSYLKRIKKTAFTLYG